ncbi:MAG: molybdopterin-dependent oxidoreductase [Spirosomataceae bacterium]
MKNSILWVCIDIYINETTNADIILPPATGLEIAHYDLTFNIAIRNVARFSEPLFDKGEDTKYDWEIFQELTADLQENLLSTSNHKILI